MRIDIQSQLADYRGLLTWNSYTTYLNGSLYTMPSIQIPLYIKENPIPIRKPKMTEINTMQNIDPMSGVDLSVSALFFGVPDPLQVALSGWIITPKSGSVWSATSSTGTALNLGNVNYTEIITAFIEGRMDYTVGGAVQRRDPDLYTSSYGHTYPKPIISVWEPALTTNMRKQTFNMTLVLEK